MTKDVDKTVFSAAIGAFIILQVVMLGSLYADIAPHPPAATPLFGIAPFLAMSLSVAFAAALFGPSQRIGKFLGLLAALMAAVSFGPQKYVDAQFPMIWPAVVTGQLAIAVMCVVVFKRRKPSIGPSTR